MIRIIHLSDFHLNEQNLRDWNNYVKVALISKLKELQKEKKIDLVLCTGDNIDKGGKDFKSAKTALNLFKTEILSPVVNEFQLNLNQFLIIPGNHDIERNKDREITEKGLIEHLKTHENISNFILNALEKNDFYGIERIRAFNEFEKELYSESSINHSSFGVKIIS